MNKLITFILLAATLLVACARLPGSSPSTATPPCFNQPTSPPPANPPNIIFIITDDQDVASLEFMPQVQALLAAQGLQMDNFFVNIPQCCPSRATVLLGQYSHNTGILRNGGDQGGFKTFFRLGLEQSTLAVGLKPAGYRTMLAGKYLNGYPGAARKRTYVPPGWDAWYVPVAGNPYSNFRYKLNDNGQIVNYQAEPDDYFTDVMADKAVAFIEQSQGQPFFMYLAPYAPHGPATPAPRHAGLFAGQKAPRSAAFNEADISDKPAYLRNLPSLTAAHSTGIDNLYQARLESLQAVDEMVARLVNTLEQTGQLENTYIIYTSDNGFHLGLRRMDAGKLTPYDEDTRVPFLVRGPGIAPASRSAAIAGNVDLAATFATIAGLQPGGTCDGRSLLPIFNAQQPETWRQAYLLEYWAGQLGGESEIQNDTTLEPVDGTGTPGAAAPASAPTEPPPSESETGPGIPAYRGLRTIDTLYVEYETGEVELYDLANDPLQLNNLAPTADPALLKQFSTWLAAFSACQGTSCLQADQLP